MTIEFTYEEIRAYLAAWGYTIKKRKMEFSRSVYHNDVECYDAEVEVVFKNGKKVKMEYHVYDHGSAPQEVFKKEFKKRLFKSLAK